MTRECSSPSKRQPLGPSASRRASRTGLISIVESYNKETHHVRSRPPLSAPSCARVAIQRSGLVTGSQPHPQLSSMQGLSGKRRPSIGTYAMLEGTSPRGSRQSSVKASSRRLLTNGSTPSYKRSKRQKMSFTWAVTGTLGKTWSTSRCSTSSRGSHRGR